MKDAASSSTFVALVALWLGCGGATRSPDAADAGGGAATTSVAGSGGASTIATSGPATGTGSGGAAGSNSSGAGGAGTAGTGTGGAGGLPDICKLPKVYGTCDAAFSAWWHDPATGVCVPFTYGGCDGNANNFPSLEACQDRCDGGEPDMDACTAAADCALVGTGCCGACDRETATSFVSVNRAQVKAYTESNRCTSTCGACALTPEGERTRQYIMPLCQAGRCTVIDIRETELVDCEKDEQCVLRDGLECCQSCDGEGIVALRSAPVDAVLCPVPIPPCVPCVSKIPASYAARCIDTRCTVSTAP